jgi:5-methyltetrahydrofolate--homocysteine methyltransferase
MDELVARKKIARSGSVALAGVAQRIHQATPVPVAPVHAVADCCPTHAAIRANLPKRAPNLPPSPDLPPAPFWGSRVVTDVRLEEIYGFINERTLISTQWQFRKNNVNPTVYAKQMTDVALPTLARLKEFCIRENVLRPAVAYGFYPCGSDGDDLIVFAADGHTERARFTFPRQDHNEYLCLSDYFAPLEAGRPRDVVSFMAVTMGHEVTRRAKELFEAGSYTDYMYLHGLGVECAEALAELWHQRIRQEWGIAGQDAPQVQKLFKKHYRGCRYAFGYPACPALEDQAKLFELIEPQRVGITLSEQFQLEPEQSTTALIAHHPQAKYFVTTRTQAPVAAEV